MKAYLTDALLFVPQVPGHQDHGFLPRRQRLGRAGGRALDLHEVRVLGAHVLVLRHVGRWFVCAGLAAWPGAATLATPATAAHNLFLPLRALRPQQRILRTQTVETSQPSIMAKCQRIVVSKIFVFLNLRGA